MTPNGKKGDGALSGDTGGCPFVACYERGLASALRGGGGVAQGQGDTAPSTVEAMPLMAFWCVTSSPEAAGRTRLGEQVNS